MQVESLDQVRAQQRPLVLPTYVAVVVRPPPSLLNKGGR